MATASTIGVTGVDATYYLTKDLQRTTEFYTNLFGFAPTMAFPDMVSEWTFEGGQTFGLYKPHSDDQWHVSSGVLFNVPDIKRAVEAGKAAGIAFDGEVDETPVCFMAFAKDPEGSTFILHQPK